MENNSSTVVTHNPTWCPGCGNFGIWHVLKGVIPKIEIKPENLVLVYDIGCNSNMYNWLPETSFEGLHGRTLPVATGIKLMRPELNVVAIAGDGGCLGEGGNHFLHASRRNLDITLLIHNNQIYGLTAGQTSPTSDKGFKTKSTPQGAQDLEMNPVLLAISAGATFAARSFAGDFGHLTETITQAVNHKGFSVVDILQPCITFNNLNTFQWFRERVYKMENKDLSNKLKAIEKALEWPTNDPIGKIPIGVFYQEEKIVAESGLPEKKINFEELVREFL